MSADAVTLDLSMEDKSEKAPLFVDKQWLYVNDQNQGSYSGQIVVSTTALSNNGSFVDYKEAYLVIPTVLQVQSAAIAVADAPLDFFACLKSGSWQLLHSMSIELNGSSVQQQTGFLNLYTSFKNLTSWSEDDLKCWGAVTGFYPDSADSWVYNTTVASATNVLAGNGTGLSNNRIAQTFALNGISASRAGFATSAAYTTNWVTGTEATVNSDSVNSCANHGLMQRMKWLNYQVGAGATTQFAANMNNASANKSALLGGDATRTKALFKGYVEATATGRSIVFPAIVRLKDVSDFFAKMPMCKGAAMTLYINTNQCLCKFAQVALGATAAGSWDSFGSLQLTEAPTILGGGGTCPIMLSSASAGQGMANAVAPGVVAGAATVAGLVGVSIAKTQFSNFTDQVTAPITSVRLYAPCYTMTAQNEQKYISEPIRKVAYEDIFGYQFNAVTTDFNFLVSNGLPGLRSIVIIPVLPQASNGTVTGSAGVYAGGVLSSSLLSPFSSTGGTPDPVALTNLNCQISGRNILSDNEQYDFQAFTQQLATSNQLNGSQTTGIASGLIGQHEFDTLYRYYYFDCSRGRPGEAGVPRSIQILGQVVGAGAIAVNLHVFAAFSREITIDVRTGSRVS
jgi:hypothetical protein